MSKFSMAAAAADYLSAGGRNSTDDFCGYLREHHNKTADEKALRQALANAAKRGAPAEDTADGYERISRGLAEAVEYSAAGNHVILSGPPGVGKSHAFAHLFRRPDVKILKGNVSGVVLHCEGYAVEAGGVLVLDDVQGVADGTLAPQLRDMTDKNNPRSYWAKASLELEKRETPQAYPWHGRRLLVLTNRDFKRGKQPDAVQALVDRCVNVDLHGFTRLQVFDYVAETARRAKLAEAYGISGAQEEVLTILRAELPALRNISLRVVDKALNLRKGYPQDWIRRLLAEQSGYAAQQNSA